MAPAARDIKALKLTSKRLQTAPGCELETIVQESLYPVLLKLGVREQKVSAPCWHQVLGRCTFFRTEASLQKERHAVAMKLIIQMNDLIAANPEWKLNGVSEGLVRLLHQDGIDEDVATLELGISIQRCSCAELRSLAGMLLTHRRAQSGERRAHRLHLTFHSLSAFATIIEDYGGEKGPVPFVFSTSKDGRAQDQQELLRFCMNVILMFYSGVDSSHSGCYTNAHTPAGLSIADVEETPPGVPVNGGPGVHKKIMGLLNLCVVCDNFPLIDAALIALAASQDSNLQVSSLAEFVLETRCSRNGVLCCDLLEDEAFILRAFELLCGSQSDVPPEHVKGAAPTPLRIRLYGMCAISVTACNMAPHILEVVKACMEDIIDPRDHELQHMAGKLVLWVLENANEDVVACVAKPMLDGAIYALRLLPIAAPTPSPPVRRILYQVVGQVAERAPQEFKGDVTTAAGFFAKLETELYRLSETVNETVCRLACAYTALPSPEVNTELQFMLQWQAKSSNERARSCAMVWALSIFPKDPEFLHSMEYLCADRKFFGQELQPTKLMEPESNDYSALSVRAASSRFEASTMQGWPAEWAAMQGRVQAGTLKLFRTPSEDEDSIISEIDGPLSPFWKF